MLRKFAVYNYKNFKDEIVLDLTASRGYNYNTHCIRDGLINKAILIGPNASGKTNLGMALFDIVYTLTDNQAEYHQLDDSSFINGDGKDKYASFKYEFQQGKTIINYEYHKTHPAFITYEKFAVNGKTIFEFKYAEGNNGKNTTVVSRLDLIGAEKLNTDSVGGTLSALRFIANNSPQPQDSPIYFVMDFVKRMLYFKSVQDGNTYCGLTKGLDDINRFIVKNGLIKDFQKLLTTVASIDMNLGQVNAIEDLIVQNTRTKKLDFTLVASSGTKAVELFYYWSKKFEDVSFLFIDEFDAFYHYELAEKILGLVNGYSNMQSLVTSHNILLIGNEIMRPDCDLLISNGKVKSLSDRTDRELREGHNLMKMMRNGEFYE